MILGCNLGSNNGTASITVFQGNVQLVPGVNFDFGQSQIGISILKDFSITNTGASNLDLSASTALFFSGVNAADFIVAVSPFPSIIPSGQTGSFSLSFNPTLVGTETAEFQISGLSGTLFSCPVTGQGT
jgi:hypothetical protein